MLQYQRNIQYNKLKSSSIREMSCWGYGETQTGGIFRIQQLVPSSITVTLTASSFLMCAAYGLEPGH